MAAQVVRSATRARPCHATPALRMVDSHASRCVSMGEGECGSEEGTSWSSVSERTCGMGVSLDLRGSIRSR
eukprot:742031-Rhodomonas_salina.1